LRPRRIGGEAKRVEQEVKSKHFDADSMPVIPQEPKKINALKIETKPKSLKPSRIDEGESIKKVAISEEDEPLPKSTMNTNKLQASIDDDWNY
jgi:hypothetical protein